MTTRIFLFLALFWGLLQSDAAADAGTIGALADLTGNFARLGEDCRGGYEVAVQGSKSSSKVIFGDNQNDPKAGISEFRRMVDAEHASSVVTTRSPVGLALNSLSAREKIPLIGIVGHPRFVGENDYAVRVFPSAEAEARVLAKAADEKESKLAIVSIEDEYFLGLRDAFMKDLKKTVVVFNETISPKDTDFGTLVARLRAKSPNAVFINGGPSQISILVRKLRDLNFPVKLYSNFLAGSSDVLAGLDRAGDGLIFAELDYEQPKFVDAFSKLLGKKPLSPLSYACYVAMMYAMSLSDEDSSAEGLAKTRQVQTLDGPITFLNREGQFPVVLKILQDGESRKVGSKQD